jgi:hypothetical protein
VWTPIWGIVRETIRHQRREEPSVPCGSKKFSLSQSGMGRGCGPLFLGAGSQQVSNLQSTLQVPAPGQPLVSCNQWLSSTSTANCAA